MDLKTSGQICKRMLEVSGLLDEVAMLVAESQGCLADEKDAYLKTIGKLMGIIGIDVLNGIFRTYPELKPEDYYLPPDVVDGPEVKPDPQS